MSNERMFTASGIRSDDLAIEVRLMFGNSVCTVLIATNVRLHGEGIGELLRRHTAFAVIGPATTPDDVTQCIESAVPEVVLLDHAMPDALGTLRAVQRSHPSCCVIAIGLPDDAALLTWAEAGAAGLLARDAAVDDLRNAIDSALRGELHCSAHVAGTLLRTIASRAAAERAAPARLPITPREAEIVRLIDDGMSNKEIATRLGIALPTVKNHIHNLLEKLRVARRSEAAARLRGYKPVVNRV
jgi:two-component system nitrate/nitrite response regulator NarL